MNALSQEIKTNLFDTKSGLVEFVIISEELESLFEYCFLFQESGLRKIRSLYDEINEIEERKSNLQTVDGFAFSKLDYISGLTDFEIPNWENILKVTIPLNQIVLIYSFFERSLNILCSEYSPKNSSKYFREFKIRINQNKGESIIKSSIEYLKNHCDLPIPYLTSELNLIDNEIREIRNKFVHGDWEYCERYIETISINEVFISISNYLRAIEDVYIANQRDL